MQKYRLMRNIDIGKKRKYQYGYEYYFQTSIIYPWTANTDKRLKVNKLNVTL